MLSIENPTQQKNNSFFFDIEIYTSKRETPESFFTSSYEYLRKKLRRKTITNLKGNLSRFKTSEKHGFSSTANIRQEKFNFPSFLKYKQDHKRLYLSNQWNHTIMSISNISINKHKGWNGKLDIEVGYPDQKLYSNGDNRNTCKLNHPKGFDWDMNDNMYICNRKCICKVDAKSNQVSLVAGHEIKTGFKDGNNDEARFNGLSGMLCCYEQNHSSSLVLYVCDCNNHCIRMIDITNGKTTTLAAKGKKEGDADGTLQSARFHIPWDIVKDDDHILYISDSENHKIKMTDTNNKGMVSTLVGDKNDTSILNNPRQMQIIDSFIYVACSGFKDCIVRIDKNSKQLTKIPLSNSKQVKGGILGIAYHELDQCFYVSDYHNIYKLE